MELTTDVTLLFPAAVNNNIFSMLQVWTMKLNESTNIFYASNAVACTIKVNIKETFMGNEGFLQMFIWQMDCSQGIRDLLLFKFSI